MGLCDIVAQRHLTSARDTQRQALAPFPVRAQRNGWGLTRAARPAIHPPFAPRERRDALLRAALPGSELPREMAGVLTLEVNGAGSFNSVSHPVPFPFTLIGITWYGAQPTSDTLNRIEFWIVDTDNGSNSLRPTGTLVYQQPFRAANITGAGVNRSPHLASTIAIFSNLPTPQLQMSQPGKRIAMHYSTPIVTAFRLSAIWNVREILLA